MIDRKMAMSIREFAKQNSMAKKFAAENQLKWTDECFDKKPAVMSDYESFLHGWELKLLAEISKLVNGEKNEPGKMDRNCKNSA